MRLLGSFWAKKLNILKNKVQIWCGELVIKPQHATLVMSWHRSSWFHWKHLWFCSGQQLLCMRLQCNNSCHMEHVLTKELKNATDGFGEMERANSKSTLLLSKVGANESQISTCGEKKICTLSMSETAPNCGGLKHRMFSSCRNVTVQTSIFTDFTQHIFQKCVVAEYSGAAGVKDKYLGANETWRDIILAPTRIMDLGHDLISWSVRFLHQIYEPQWGRLVCVKESNFICSSLFSIYNIYILTMIYLHSAALHGHFFCIRTVWVIYMWELREVRTWDNTLKLELTFLHSVSIRFIYFWVVWDYPFITRLCKAQNLNLLHNKALSCKDDAFESALVNNVNTFST